MGGHLFGTFLVFVHVLACDLDFPQQNIVDLTAVIREDPNKGEELIRAYARL